MHSQRRYVNSSTILQLPIPYTTTQSTCKNLAHSSMHLAQRMVIQCLTRGEKNHHSQSRRQQTNGCRGVDLSMRHICRSNPQMHTAFENLMIHVHLQIAITIALRCVLHRRGNRGIPCQNFCFFKDFRHRHTIGWSKKIFFLIDICVIKTQTKGVIKNRLFTAQSFKKI